MALRRIVMLAWFGVLGCTDAETRVHVEIVSTATATLDGYQLRVGTKLALAAPLVALDVVVPDDTAGLSTTLEVWGLAAGSQVAYGTTTVTPSLHHTVASTVSLAAVTCGTLCTDQATACASDGITTCEQQPDGCFAWSVVMPCPADAAYCSNGTCSAVCTDECTAGATRCDSAVAMRTCGQFDADTCLDWSLPVACASGTTCTNGACAPTVACQHDGDACDDGDACTENDTCAGGTCSGTPKTCPAPPHGQSTCANAACDFTCDPGYMKSGSSCAPTTKLVFVTSVQYTGAMGGLSGADAKCQALAQAAGRSGTFKAWLSSSTKSASVRMTHASVPYALVDGSVVAADWSHLLAVPHLHAIDLDEFGTVVNDDVWTGTNANATAADPGCSSCECNDWTTDGETDAGQFGVSTSATATWSLKQAAFCGAPDRLYCFEQ